MMRASYHSEGSHMTAWIDVGGWIFFIVVKTEEESFRWRKECYEGSQRVVPYSTVHASRLFRFHSMDILFWFL